MSLFIQALAQWLLIPKVFDLWFLYLDTGKVVFQDWWEDGKMGSVVKGPSAKKKKKLPCLERTDVD